VAGEVAVVAVVAVVVGEGGGQEKTRKTSLIISQVDGGYERSNVLRGPKILLDGR
jgi:hypothetical protein